MTVQELIDELQAIEDKTRIVILQKDAEGNGYSPLRGADDNAVYAAETTWHGEVRYQRLTAELRQYGYDDDDVGDGAPCVVLYPIN